MRNLTPVEYQIFKDILCLKQEKLKKVIRLFLEKNNYTNICETKDYVYAEGDIPIALVAHLDTVFPSPPKHIFYDRVENVMWSPNGLGADDRAGVFAIMQILRDGLRPHVIFTTDEEKGCLGSLVLSKKDMPFKELKYLIQLDRSGANDCVFYECNNAHFIDYVEKFGFLTDIGSFSDISALCPSWKIAGVNLSIGYYHEHYETEHLDVSAMLFTIKRVKKMLMDSDSVDQFKYIPSYKSRYQWNFNPIYTNDNFEVVKCKKCEKEFFEAETIPVKSLTGDTSYYCIDCIGHNVNWCSICGEPYEVCDEIEYPGYCPDCKRLIWNPSRNNSMK